MLGKKLFTVLFLGILGTLIVIGTIKFLPLKKTCQNCTHEHGSKTTPPTQGPVTTISTVKEFTHALNSKKDMIIKFYANWCGACNYVKGPFAEAAHEFSNIHFYDIDVDNQDIMNYVDEHKIGKVEALPTFLFFKNGKSVEKIVGGMNKEHLKKEIKQIFS